MKLSMFKKRGMSPKNFPEWLENFEVNEQCFSILDCGYFRFVGKYIYKRFSAATAVSKSFES